MSQMETLPDECLLYLLSFVEQDTHSLHALLLTSRTLFRLVAPVLYRNPFGRLETQSGISDRQPQAKLLRLLLACCPSEVKLDLSQYHRPRSPITPPSIDYLSFYKHHSEKSLFNVVSLAFPHTQPARPPSKNLTSMPYQDDPTDMSKCPSAPPPLNTLVQRSLVGHSPKHIHTLGFSMHSIDVLEPLVTRLSSLVRLELFKAPSRPQFSGAQAFIKRHRQHFPSQLQEIKIVANDALDYCRLLEAMGQPRVIDVAGWAHADAYLDRFPLQECRVLLMRLGTPNTASNLDPAILTRCAQLQTVRMPVFHQDLFSWTKDRYLNHSIDLRSISLWGVDSLMVPALVDACDGLRSTLRELSSTSGFAEPAKVSLSWQWNMPHLTRLDLEGTVAACFDMDSLKYCPALMDLFLNVGRKIPNGWDPMSKAQQLSNVSEQLRRLELSGWWNLPDAALTGPLLPVLKRLSRLNIMFCNGPSGAKGFSGACIVELLPQLTSLRLLEVSATLQEQQDLLNTRDAHGLCMEIDIQPVRK
ncbi:MAG: hypothetical protein J3Q66DRAFT_61845 [Benniella sp.]|nr:MAG: hypothetical protein J3Q66DRAFT_61845 [Benniella sp.]